MARGISTRKHTTMNHIIQILLILATALIHICYGQQNLTIGVILPSIESIMVSEPGYTDLLNATHWMIEWVADDVNHRVAIPAGYRFNIELYDTKYTRRGSVHAVTRAARQAGMVGLIGEWTSANTVPATLSSDAFNIPMCGGASTADELSDKKTFPLFFRLLPADSGQGEFLAQLALHLKWTTVNLISMNHAYGQSLSTTFKLVAKALNIAIEGDFLAQPAWTVAEATAVLSRLTDSSSRIVFFMGNAEDFMVIPKAGYKLNLSPSDWTWVGGDGWSSLYSIGTSRGTPGASNLTDSELLYLNGTLHVYPAEMVPGFPRFDSLAARWRQQFGNNIFSESPYALFMASCGEILIESWVNILGRVGIQSVLNRTHTPALADFISTPRDTVSGRAVFTEKGDRSGYFEVYNLHMGSNQLYKRFVGGSFVQINEPVFANGLSAVPNWKAKYTEMFAAIESPGVQAVLVITGLAMALVVGSWCLIVYHRKSRRIRHLGLPFTAVLCIGLLLSLMTPFLAAGYPTDFTCSAQYWTLVLGFSLSLSSIWIRSYRIFKVFDNRVLSKSQSVKTSSLVRRMLILPMVQVILLIVLQVQGPFLPMSKRTTSSVAQLLCADTSGKGIGDILLFSAAGLDVALLALLAWVAYKIRTIHTSYQDTIYIAYSMHNLIITAVLCAIIGSLFDGQSIIMFYVKSLGALYANGAIFLTMVFRHVYHLPSESKQQTQDPNNMVNSVNEEEGDSTGGVSNGAGSSSGQGTGSALQGRTHFAGVYAIKSSTGFLRRWTKCEVTLLQAEGLLSIFDPNSATAKSSGRAFRIKHCLIDPDPAEYELCLAISCPGTDSFVIQFNSATERSRWAAVMSTVGAAQRDPSASMTGAVASMVHRARAKSIRTGQVASGQGQVIATGTLGASHSGTASGVAKASSGKRKS